MRGQSSSSKARASTQKPSSASAKKQNVKDKSEQRRERNLEHAKRYKERVKNEPLWFALQYEENEDRIRNLERKVRKLTEEATAPPLSRHSHFMEPQHEKRPDWFGEPF